MTCRDHTCSFALVLGALMVVLSPQSARAHRFAPALLELSETPLAGDPSDDASNEIAVMWKTARANRALFELVPVFPPHCREVGERAHFDDATARVERWRMRCDGPEGLRGGTLSVAGLEASGGEVLVRLDLGDLEMTEVLTGGQPTLTIPAEANAGTIGRTYLQLGVIHILVGPDHLAFLLGLLLLVGSRRRLVITITAFTLGHSVTLGLATFELVQLAPNAVEAVIALSILLLATEVARDHSNSVTVRLPWLVAALFGLVHGLGLASALTDAGIPSSEVGAALLYFNLGVEVGQLLFVGALLGCWWVLSGALGHHRARLRRLAAYLLGVAGAAWFIERLIALVS